MARIPPATDLARSGSPRTADSPHPPAGLAELVRLYGLRQWIEQSYKQIMDELGWADFQVCSDTAIRRHQTLVNCAFSFCWDAWFADEPPAQDQARPPETADGPERGPLFVPPAPAARLAPGHPRDPRLARPWNAAGTLGRTRPAARTPSTHRLVGHRPIP
jgi:hypothetical protein